MTSATPTKNRLHKGGFLLFLCLSLLFHLVVGLLFLQWPILPAAPKEPEKTPVALEERKNWLELDQKPRQPDAEPPKEATHLAESNQKVKQEAAPKGQDSRDQEQQAPPMPPQISRRPEPPTRQKLPSTEPTPEDRAVTRDKDLYATRPKNPPPEPERLDIPLELPKLSDLTRLSQTTQSRLDREQRKRTKERSEVELEADAVWLNLQQMDNKLLSFFRRFRSRIEAVWNYPTEASSRGIEGTLLIKIIVNKKGELLDALPLESSGSDILDYEAIQAIYRAAPFGKLPNYYPHEQLKIYAYFQYNLSRRMIYGQP